MKVEERLLKYVTIWTTSDEESQTVPSSMRQFDLAKILEQEMKQLGLSNVLLTDQCYLYGLLPATAGYENAKSVGFIAHIDTAPDYCGENVKPQIITNYDGKDVLLEGSGEYLKVSDFSDLTTLQGRTLITTDGTTLLGADDKAGVAVILTMIEDLISSNTPHGDIWIGFTPDEEIGTGSHHFDLDYFKADFAYTIDGAYEGEIAYENFNAAGAVFQIRGVNVHPGEAKDIMINAAQVGCEIAASLPADEIPSKTSGREGFFHLMSFEGEVSSAKLEYIVRDHDKDIFESRLNQLRTLEVSMNQKYGAGTVTLEISHSYENMLSVIKEHMEIIEIAENAIRSVGLEPVSEPVRGGTDGAQLSFRGLPCPNLGAGGYGFHGPYEHISVEGMETSVRIAKEIVNQTLSL